MKQLCILVMLCLTTTFVLAEDKLVIYVLRHAEKTAQPSSDPVLTEQGRQRANNLTKLLCPKSIDAVFSTDYTRTRQTVEPLADCLDVEISLYPPSKPDQLAERIIEHYPDGRVVIVGHSNTVAGIMSSLGVSNAPELAETDYGDLFKLTLIAGSAVIIKRETY